jgi:membrane glycosyltransferase
MVVSMDGRLNPQSAQLHLAGGMPPELPQFMPVQDLGEKPDTEHAVTNDVLVWLARLLVFVGTATIAGYGIFEMLAIVGFLEMTIPQGVMLFFFAITFTWIAFTAASTLTGILVPPARFEATNSLGNSLTVLLMPIHNENPTPTTAALQAMAEGLEAHGVAHNFEIVVISDSTNDGAWIAETIALTRLRDALERVMPVWYRRRWDNVGSKSGNVEDFVKRWGGRYDYMVVLDADSLMMPQTVITMIRRMEGDPQLGLLQTVPVLIGQWSFFARLQQFAGRVYGSAIVRGLAAWSGNDGNFWGHNAVIRISAFAQGCGLPVLPGPKPFGGHIMSHDFVEAALMRRAGWKVRMAPDLEGSWEESPPSLIEVANRDRRWAQGNLQHTKVIRACGLSLVSRVHFSLGIMSYIASPLWLLTILTGFGLTLQASLTRFDYFPRGLQLFPDWPRFDSERMVTLFIFSMIILLVPKIMGLIRSIISSKMRRGSGGISRLLASTILETVFSALYAPLMMLIQTNHVLQILTGRDSGWSPQRRSVSGVPWREVWLYHWKHTLFGFVVAFCAFLLSPILLAWLSPALLGLMLAVPLSKASSSAAFGRWLARYGILRIPEEMHPPDLVRRRDDIARTLPPLPTDGLWHLARNSQSRLTHLSHNLPPPAGPRGYPDGSRLTAERKIRDAQTLQEALQWLSPSERMLVAADAGLLEHLAMLPDV